MKAWLVVVLAWMACSTPATKKQDSPAPPTDDEEAAAAWQRTHPAPPPGQAPYDWDKIRKNTLELKATSIGSRPCDYRGGPRAETIHCTRGSTKMPIKLAALVKHTKVGYPTGIQVELDIGEENLEINQTWVFALLDAEGQPGTKWVHPDEVRRSVTLVTFPSVLNMKTEDLRVVAMDVPP